jgi:hypothetical protein
MLRFIIVVVAFMIIFAVGVEFAYFESKRRNGFPVISLGHFIGPGFFIVSLVILNLLYLTHKLLKVLRTCGTSYPSGNLLALY